MDSNYLSRLSGLSDDQITNMLVNDNGNIQLSSELINQFAITPKLCAKILLDMCDPNKSQETQMMPQRFEEIDSAANLCREFLPSSSPLMNIIQAIDNSSAYLLSKNSSRQVVPPGLYSNNDVNNSSSVLPNVNSINDLNDRIDNLSLNGSMNAFNSQSRQQFTSSQLPLATHLNVSLVDSTIQQQHQVGPISSKLNQLQSSIQQQQPQGDNMINVNAIFSESSSSINPEIEKEAAAYFQRIYNQSTSENLSINEVLDMLGRFQSSPNKQERDIFHCMVKNLFKEYCYFPQYPDKELSLTAQLFGGIIQQDLVKFVALVDALTCVLEALRQPFGSKMFCFGIAALDQFKSKLKEYPLYCRHLTTIPHFSEFPLTLQEYIQFGAASKDPPSTQFLTVDDVDPLHVTVQHHNVTSSHSPVSSLCHPNSGSTGLIMNSLMGVNNMKNDVNLLMPELINNQGIIGGSCNHKHNIGSQEDTNNIGIGNSGLSPIQSEINNLNNSEPVTLISNNSLASSPVISRPSINRNGPSSINTNTDTLRGNTNKNFNHVNNASDNNSTSVAINAVSASTYTATTETIQQTSNEPQNYASTSDQPCHASSTTTPTSYSDIVKRAIKVVPTLSTTTTITNTTNSTAPTNNITNKDGTKAATVVRKNLNNLGDNADSTIGSDSPKQNSSSGKALNGNRENNGANKKVNSNGCTNQTNGLENFTYDDQSELSEDSNNYNNTKNISVNSTLFIEGSTTNSNCNGNLAKLKPTNIWAYNGLRVSNVSNSCSRSTLQSLFNKFGRVKLIERINKTIENSIWVYYDNPSSPVEAAHKLQGVVIEGISVNGSVPLRLYFAPTDDQKDLKFSRPKQPPDNKGECYYWRTTNCFSREQCPLLHIPANKNIDAQIWMGKMNKESTSNNNQQQPQQQLITQSNSK